MQTITVQLKIENYYEGASYPVVTTPTIEAPTVDVDDADELEEWGEEHVYPVTGVGRTMGGSAYFIEVAACPDLPALVGRKFEYGL